MCTLSELSCVLSVLCVSAVWPKPAALGCLQRPHRGCAHPAQSRLRPGHPRRREYPPAVRQLRPQPCFSTFPALLSPAWQPPGWNDLFKTLSTEIRCNLMSSSGLEWDPLDCPLVGLPSGCGSSFPARSDKTDRWRCRVHSLWTVSSATGCDASSATGGSGRRSLRRQEEREEEEEKGRRQWRKAEREPGGSGRVKEVSRQHREFFPFPSSSISFSYSSQTNTPKVKAFTHQMASEKKQRKNAKCFWCNTTNNS